MELLTEVEARDGGKRGWRKGILHLLLQRGEALSPCRRVMTIIEK